MLLSKKGYPCPKYAQGRGIHVKKFSSFWQFSVLILLCTAVLSTGIFLYVNRLSTLLHNNTKTYLAEVAKQGVNTIESKIQDDFNLLQSIATAIGVIPNPTEQMITRLMKAESKTNNFKRMGFVYPDGIAILSDDLLLDIHHEPHFTKAMAGTPNVSNLIKDASDGKNIFVESVPVYHQDKIIGVLFATRSTEEYTQALDIESFGGEGYSIIVRANGDKIVGASHKNAVSGMYNIFNSPDDPDHELAHNIQQALKNRRSGTIHYLSAEKGELHISYEPLKINDWYLFSVVPTAHLSAQLNAFITLLLILCLAIAVAGLVVWGYVFLQQKKNKEQLFNYAYVDPVTGFPNAEANRTAAEQLLKENPKGHYAMVALDVSKFKIFNEQHGYEVGNILLKHIARLIKNNLQPQELCTRIYGDYFAMLLKYTDEGTLKNRLELLGEQITNFQTENHQAYAVLLSFGVYPIEDKSMPIRVMYNRAAVAKSQIKGRYDQIVAFYKPDWQQKLEEEDFIERHMQHALKKGEMKVLLEPIVSLENGKIGAASVTAEWKIEKEKKTLSIRQFLPVFRKNGFIYQFDLFLFEQACKILAQWQKENLPLIPLVINLANELFLDVHFVQHLTQKTTEYGILPKWIVIELTETAQTEFLPQLERAGAALRKAGFGLTVRYSGQGVTLSNIFQHLPVEGIKIAPGVWAPNASEKQQLLARAIVEMCRKLQVFLAAEGVQTPQETEHIKKLGFQFAQGSGLFPTVTAEKLAEQFPRTQENSK